MTDTRRPTIIDLSDATTDDAREPEVLVLPGLEGEGDATELDRADARAYADWTPFEDAFLRQERLRGRSLRSMAEALRRTPGAVGSRLRKLEAT